MQERGTVAELAVIKLFNRAAHPLFQKWSGHSANRTANESEVAEIIFGNLEKIWQQLASRNLVDYKI